MFKMIWINLLIKGVEQHCFSWSFDLAAYNQTYVGGTSKYQDVCRSVCVSMCAHHLNILRRNKMTQTTAIVTFLVKKLKKYFFWWNVPKSIFLRWNVPKCIFLRWNVLKYRFLGDSFFEVIGGRFSWGDSCFEVIHF